MKEIYKEIKDNLFYSTNKTRDIEAIVSFAKCSKWHYEAIIRDLRLNTTQYIILGTIEYKVVNDCGIIDNFIYKSQEIDYCLIHNDNELYKYFKETLESIKQLINAIYINEIMIKETNEND